MYRLVLVVTIGHSSMLMLASSWYDTSHHNHSGSCCIAEAIEASYRSHARCSLQKCRGEQAITLILQYSLNKLSLGYFCDCVHVGVMDIAILPMSDLGESLPHCLLVCRE